MGWRWNVYVTVEQHQCKWINASHASKEKQDNKQRDQTVKVPRNICFAAENNLKIWIKTGLVCLCSLTGSSHYCSVASMVGQLKVRIAAKEIFEAIFSPYFPPHKSLLFTVDCGSQIQILEVNWSQFKVSWNVGHCLKGYGVWLVSKYLMLIHSTCDSAEKAEQ